jgi:hypothetical protein
MQPYETYNSVTWGVVGLAGLALPVFIATVAGYAEPYVSPPSEPLFGLGLIAAVGIGGLLANRFVEAWHWAAVGREAGLAPAETGLPRPALARDDDALVGKSVLSATVRGRPVRARVYTRSKEGGADDSSESTTFTVVEADLAQPADHGVIVSRVEGGVTDLPEGTTTVHDDPFAALADEASQAEGLLSGDAREALLSVEEFTLLFVGHAEKTVEDAMPDYGDQVPDVAGFSVGSMLQEGLESLLSSHVVEGDRQTVTHRMEGVLLDPGELRRQVEAVVAVADVYERATTDAESG